MTGFQNVIDGVEHFFDAEYKQVAALFAPVADSVVASLKANAGADFAGAVAAIGADIAAGKKGNDLLTAAEGVLAAQGIKLGEAALSAFVAAVQVKFAG